MTDYTPEPRIANTSDALNLLDELIEQVEQENVKAVLIALREAIDQEII